MKAKDWIAAIVVDVLAIFLMYLTWANVEIAGNVLAFVCVAVVFGMVMQIIVASGTKTSAEAQKFFGKYDSKAWQTYDGVTNFIHCAALAAIGWVWTAAIILILSFFKRGAVGMALERAKKKAEPETEAA